MPCEGDFGVKKWCTKYKKLHKVHQAPLDSFTEISNFNFKCLCMSFEIPYYVVLTLK